MMVLKAMSDHNSGGVNEFKALADDLLRAIIKSAGGFIEVDNARPIDN